jgi:hypothetical protein
MTKGTEVVGWRQTLVYLALPVISMLVSMLITWLVVSANPYLYSITLPTLGTLIEGLIFMVVIGIVGGIATAITFQTFKRGGELFHRILIGAFLSPVFFLLSIFVGETLLLIITFQAPNQFFLSLISMSSIFFAMLSIALIMTDALGASGRNFVFSIYGIVLGVFLCIAFPWFSSLSLMAVLAAADTFFARKLGPIVIEADPNSHSRSAFVFVIGDMVIGIGDLIIYSALVSYAMRFFGPTIAFYTLLAVIIGCIINTQLVARNPNRILPGLPIPLLCALVPILFSLYQVTMLGLMLSMP